MAWHVGKSETCSIDQPFAVIDDEDGQVEDCFGTQTEAQNAVSSLEAGDTESNSLSGGVEFRTFAMEVRLAGSPTEPRIDGYAAVFNSNSEEMGFFDKFVERITPGAFDAVLGDDVRALVNHDPNFVLGRSKSGTLRLAADSKGLHSDITPPDTQWARDLVVSMKRGDIDQMSFGFTVANGGEHVEQDGAVRVIDKVKRLFDVSVVTFPAYPASSVQARMYMESLSKIRRAPQPQRGPAAVRQPRFTAVTLNKLNRRLHMAEDYALSHGLNGKEKPNGNVD